MLRDFRNFPIHIGLRPAEGWTLDEAVRGRGYVVNNCRWALRNGLQLENRKVTKWHAMPDGKRLLTKHLAKHLGISANALRKQHRRGRTVQQLLDKYQKNQGLHAWTFPEEMVHVLEPLYQKRTRFMQSRLEWFIPHLDKRVYRYGGLLDHEAREALLVLLRDAEEQRDQILQREEQQIEHELRQIVAALSASRPSPAAP